MLVEAVAVVLQYWKWVEDLVLDEHEVVHHHTRRQSVVVAAAAAAVLEEVLEQLHVAVAYCRNLEESAWKEEEGRHYQQQILLLSAAVT